MKKFAFRYMVVSGLVMMMCHGTGLGIYTIGNLLFAAFTYCVANIVCDDK